jgi:L-threonylcarbamoyladenylate synthase
MKYIRQGKVMVCPTDTVYGLVADATNRRAVERLFKTKKRNFKKPIPIFIKDIRAAKRLAYIDKKQEKFLRKSWPGKITIVLNRKKGYKVYGIDKKTIAFRVPKYKLINTLLEKINRPLTGTSANISGKPASTKIKEVLKHFPVACGGGLPDVVIDAGNLPKSWPSKVFDLTGEKPKILRK